MADRASEMRAALRAGQLDAAERALVAGLNEGGFPLPAVTEFIGEACEQQDYRRVEKLLAQLLPQAGQLPQLWLLSFDYHRRRFDWHACLEDTDQYLAAGGPQDWAWRAARGVALERLLRPEEALAVLERGAPPEYRRTVTITRINALLQCKRYEDVEHEAREAMPRMPDAESACEVGKLLANALDKQGRYAEAWQVLTEVSRQRSGSHPAHLNPKRRQLETFRSLYTPEWVARWTPAPVAEYTPVFLVGFPRSGTTLLEQILDAHPGIRALEEKPMVRDVLRQAQGICSVRASLKRKLRPGMDWKQQHLAIFDQLANLSAEEIRNLQAAYFRSLEHYLPDWRDSRVFVDKHPLNIANVGIIRRVFPGARFILALRHPCDCVLSSFMQNFDMNTGMANMQNIEHAAIYYRQLMRHFWQVVELLGMEEDVVSLRYEDLLDDFRGEVTRVLDFLGVGWSDEVERYYEHARERGTIATPSYTGVTRELYGSARGRWHNYAEFLEPVLPHFRDACERYGYSLEIRNSADSVTP